ncbi:DUF7289 family protein [Archaeoglobus veneficus]|uniref:Uncharacterized protein n=1 Tax=Archaeoglobus veneficus (strain DSM 11195 / SNP6) TaxID=693661 RepID=F2KN47_ARCVS|nr:hypothetical protein [Archaeoglobus veneficus]AEA46148.1 hypothetical protein Arcve_0107 [Archaeoglobus veneficus SNP6]
MREKAVSEVVGSLLMLVVVTLTVSILIVYGNPVIESNQQIIRTRNVAAMMVATSETISKVSADVMPSARVRFALSGGSLSVSSDNSLTLYVNNSTANLYTLTTTPGKIEYVHGDDKTCIECGGVWSKGSTGAYIVYPPRIKVQGSNVSIAIYEIRGSGSVGGKGFAEIEIRYNSSETKIFNTSGYVVMNITSEYAQAWKRYLEEEGFTVSSEYARVDFTYLTISRYVVDVRLWV